MSNLAADIRDTNLTSELAIWWLAQAGFVFKNPAGNVIYLDAYLSDAVERMFSFRRLTMSPIDAQDVVADAVLSSHEHADHLDVDALAVIRRNNPSCQFAGPQSCKQVYDDCGIDASRQIIMEPESKYEFGDVTVYTARADHGDLTPDALSLLLDFNGVSVLFTGDTALRPEWMQSLIDRQPDVLIPCINGAFGNLNAQTAAKLTAMIRPKVAIPCHFWMFAEHGGDPQAFIDACADLCPEVKVLTMTPGRKYTLL